MSIAGRVGIVSALLVSVGSIGGSPDGGSSDADRHAATYVSSTISAAAIDPGVMNATMIACATNTSATAAIRKGVR